MYKSKQTKAIVFIIPNFTQCHSQISETFSEWKERIEKSYVPKKEAPGIEE